MDGLFLTRLSIGYITHPRTGDIVETTKKCLNKIKNPSVAKASDNI